MGFKQGNIVKVVSLPGEDTPIGRNSDMEFLVGKTFRVGKTARDSDDNIAHQIDYFWFYSENLVRGLLKNVHTYDFDVGARVVVVSLPAEGSFIGQPSVDLVGQVGTVEGRSIAEEDAYLVSFASSGRGVLYRSNLEAAQ